MTTGMDAAKNRKLGRGLSALLQTPVAIEVPRAEGSLAGRSGGGVGLPVVGGFDPRCLPSGRRELTKARSPILLIPTPPNPDCGTSPSAMSLPAPSRPAASLKRSR